MKPVRLEFKGINSFSEHTIIDFEALTKGGIFGIFGDTGSGKSTILDAINFALYGNVERSKEKVDIINYNSDRAEVKFVFDILSGGRRKTYTVERTLKKDKSGTHKAMLYESDGEKEECIADKTTQVERKIVEILGVEAEDFRKCIALPQGEFSQFVKSTPGVRLALIERLFNLSRYGDRLKEKLSARQSEAEMKFQNLSGRLQSYEDVTAERLAEIKKKIKEAHAELVKLKKREERVTSEYERLKALNEKRAELESVKARLSALLENKEKIEELRYGLSSLNGCREVVSLAQSIEKKSVEISALSGDIERLQNEIGAHISLIYALEKSVEEGGHDEKISACVELSARYASCEGKADKLKNILTELENKRAEYKELEEEKQKLIENRREVAAQAESCKKQVETRSFKDICGLINVELKGAVLKEEYIHSLDYFANFNGNVKIFKDDSPLYKYVSDELKAKIKEYTQRIQDVREFRVEYIGEQLEKLNEAEKEREELTKSLTELNARLERLTAAVTVKQNELDAVSKIGKDLRERADELRGELERAFGKDCGDYGLAIEQNRLNLEKLRAEKQELSEKLEGAKAKRQELTVSVERLKGLLLAAESERDNLTAKLKLLIEEGALESVEKCKAHCEKFANVPDAEATVKEYDAQLSTLFQRQKELENTGGISTATDEALTAAEREKSSIYGGVTELTGNLAVLESESVTLETRLKEKAEILKQFDGVQAERNLVCRLREVTKGNKFLEFIANEYLGDISSLASSTLLKLTGGRYFLTYVDNNFSVGDNFNCGSLRGVNTLSGGETFLVSLSLALALSQTICARSMKSIEFFFLDEGFGTLDGALLEVVMDALEKLKSSSFTIGIISHVEELKNRISSKITVNKATESHGSTVTLSC